MNCQFTHNKLKTRLAKKEVPKRHFFLLAKTIVNNYNITMKVYAISDLHLSTTEDKPMTIFGARWENSIEKISADWQNKVTEDDVVLLSGDLSWAMSLENALKDISVIKDLKGKKVIIKGNHDYWWNSISKVRANLPENFYALQNDCIKFGNVIINGSRAWSVPGSTDFGEQDKKIYLREYERLKLSFEKVKQIRNDGDVLITMTHFPPFNMAKQSNLYTDLFEENNVDKVVFGHLHGKVSNMEHQIVKNNVKYFLTSCDLVNNTLVEIL